MNKNKVRFFAALGILFAVFTVIAFAVPFPHKPIFWLSYVFGVIALGAMLYAYPTAFAGESPRSKFYGFPIARIATIYLIAQLILSLLFMALGQWVPAWVAVLLFMLLLAAAALGFIAADAMRDEVERQDTVHKANVGVMRALQSKAAFIAGRCEDGETKKELDSFADALRFSDPVSSEALADIEENLTGLVEELGNAVMDKDYAAARSLCAKASSLLADRNRLCRLNK